ncbi:hypothetical protein AQAU111925_07485 [Aquirufa aurantiipilula]
MVKINFNSLLKRITENYFSFFYLLIGLSSLYFFTWTGKYLNTIYPDKHNLDTRFRVMLRSRHIFILLISLIEIGIGVYIQPCRTKFFLFLQWLTLLLIITSHLLFIYAFFFEVEIIHVPKTPILHYATYIVLASVIPQILTKWESKK